MSHSKTVAPNFMRNLGRLAKSPTGIAAGALGGYGLYQALS